jgi:hypothetical protein
LNKSNDRKMKDRKIEFGIIPGPAAPRGVASAAKRGKHFSAIHFSVI